MSKFIIVSGSYDPYPRANGVCAKAIEQTLKKNGHEVIYVVTRNNITQQSSEIINGNKVFFIPRAINDVHWCFSKMNDSFLFDTPEKFILKIAHTFVKLTFKLLAFFKGKSSRSAANENYRRNFMNVMSNLLLKEKPDGVLTFSVPFTSHLYTYDSFVKSGYRPVWISFLIDAHAQKAGVHGKQKVLFEKEETFVFKNSDACFLLNTLKESYNKEKYKSVMGKFHYFHLPFLKIPLSFNVATNAGIIKLKDTIDITFAGTLYDDSSPIEFFCSFIKECKDPRIRFHLMGKFYPNNLRKLNELALSMPKQVFVYGLKSREFVLASLKNSDILINIGNNNTNQIPSKILEYIGLQKPIFSFIRDENDAALDYLNRYPYSFVINENEENSMSSVLESAMKFYRECKKEKIALSDLRNCFKGYLEEEVTEEIVEIIEEKLDDRK